MRIQERNISQLRTGYGPGLACATVSTTSPDLAARTLSGLRAAGVGLAVLHGEEKIAAGEVGSDIDLVTERPLRSLLRGPVRSSLENLGVFPVMVWPYDVSGTVTVFFSDVDASEAVQIDALHDPDGLGKFGIRSGVLLENSAMGRLWPAVQPPFSQLYLVRKRHWKRQYGRITPELEALGGLGRQEIDKAVSQMFEPGMQRLMSDLLAGANPRKLRRETTPYRVRNLQRLMRRLSDSVGAWVEFSGPGAPEATETASQRFSRFLPLCRVGNRPTTFRSAWWVRRVAPVRLRPGLFLGVGDGRGRLRPDISIPVVDDSVSEAIRRLVGALGDRALR